MIVQCHVTFTFDVPKLSRTMKRLLLKIINTSGDCFWCCLIIEKKTTQSSSDAATNWTSFFARLTCDWKRRKILWLIASGKRQSTKSGNKEENSWWIPSNIFFGLYHLYPRSFKHFIMTTIKRIKFQLVIKPVLTSFNHSWVYQCLL